MFFTEKNRKKNLVISFLALFLFSGVIFALQAHATYASLFSYTAPGYLLEKTGISDKVGAAVADVAVAPLKWVFQWLLYGIFVMFGLLASLALTIFQWAIKPENFTLFFNNPGVYESWKFVRDFFNLFFILVLLFIAFSVVFQIEKNFKKTILSLVLAALFVNFSYPVSRALIDMTNVPMYFFANQMTARDAESGPDIFGQTLTASHLEKLLLPQDEKSDISRLLMAIVFIFLFSVTLLVLSVMFIIRLVALVVLVIFSSVGFVASIIPGLKTYSGMWWDNFWKYAFFGPAAMLMLLIATRLFSALGDGSAIEKSMTAVASGEVVVEPSFVSAMALFTIPIIMLWMAMGLAQKFSIAGASSVVGVGQRFSKWAGKKLYNNPVGRGLYGGGKKVLMEGKIAGKNYGKLPGGKFLTGDYWATPSKTEATIKGGIAGGIGGGAKERQKIKDKQINEQVKKNKEDSLSRSSALEGLKSTDEIKRVASAISLAQMDNGIQNMDDLSKALNALKDPKTGVTNESYREKAVEIVSKSDKKIITATPATATSPAQSGLQNLNTVMGALGGNQKAVSDLIAKLDDSAFTGSGADYDNLVVGANRINPDLTVQLKTKIIKEGSAHVLVESITKGNPALVQTAVDTVLDDIRSSKDMVGNVKLFQTYNVATKNYVAAQSASRQTEIKKSAAQESPEVSRIII